MKSLARLAMRTMAAAWLIAGTAPAGETYRISGVVVNSVTGRPLAQAHVDVAPDDGSSKEIEAITGVDGGFSFDGLPAGSWTLSADRKGYQRQIYGQRSPLVTGAISVVTGPKGVSEKLVFRLNPPSAIQGKVIDEHGEPVMGAFLELLVKSPGARTEFRVTKTVATDDTGEYRIPELWPVTCYLFAVVPVPADGKGFAPQYYPNSIEARSATPIQLKPGEEFTADFALHRATGVSVEIEGSSGAAGGPDSELLILLTPGPEGSEVSASTVGSGAGRVFTNVLPGRYKLVVADFKSTYATSRWIEVGSEDMTVQLPFPDPPDVTAKVRVVDGDAKLLQKAMLGLLAVGGAGNNSRPLGPDGTAAFPAMAAGRYRIALYEGGLYIKSVTAKNARVVDGLLDLPESGPVQLEITAAGDGAHVMGKVRAGGKPVSGVLVVLAPARQSANPYDYHGYQSDSDGTFDFKAVKPGDYTIFATSSQELEYGNPAAIAKFLAGGKRVKAEPNGTVETEIEPAKQ
jgi:hypothetical protein